MPRVLDILGPKLGSAVLYGSAAVGDFHPGWSDVDTVCILVESLTETEGCRIGRLHDEMAALYIEGKKDGWESGQAIEASYLPYQFLDGSTEAGLFSYVAGGTTRKYGPENPLDAFNRHSLSKTGIAIFGEKPLVRPPQTDELLAQTRAELDCFFSIPPEKMSGIMLAGVLAWAARTAVFWRDGVMLPKTPALEHEIKLSRPWKEAFQLALELRKKGSRFAADERPRLIPLFRQFCGPIKTEITELILSIRVYDS